MEAKFTQLKLAITCQTLAITCKHWPSLAKHWPSLGTPWPSLLSPWPLLHTPCISLASSPCTSAIYMHFTPSLPNVSSLYCYQLTPPSSLLPPSHFLTLPHISCISSHFLTFPHISYAFPLHFLASLHIHLHFLLKTDSY